MTSPAFNTFGNSTGVQNPFLQTAAAPQKIDPQAAVLATTLLSVLSLAMSKGGTGDKADFTNALKEALGGGPDDPKKAHKNRHGKQAGKTYGMKRKKSGKAEGAEAPKEATKAEGTGGGNAQADAAVNWAQSLVGQKGGQVKDKLKSYHAGLWCADFVSTAFSQNGESPFGTQSRAFGIRDWGKANGRYVERGKGDPKKGDAIVFDGAGGQGHVGIVKEIKDGKVITLEGNSDDEVKEKSYALTDPKIQGYVRAFGDKP